MGGAGATGGRCPWDPGRRGRAAASGGPHDAGEPKRPGPVDLSVVVPAYDEADRIAASLDRLCRYLAAWPDGAEVVVVDDGSRDGTFDIVERLVGRLPVPLRLYRHAENRGKGAAVRTGMLRSRGRLAGFTDADLAYPPEVFAAFAAAIAGGADVVVGRRHHPGQQPPALRRAAHAAFRRTVRAMLRIPVHDTQCGIKLFRGTAARALFGHSVVDGFGFDPEVLHLAARWGLRVVEVDAPLTSASPTSTVSLLRDAPRMLGDLARVRLRRIPPTPVAVRVRSGRS